MRSTNKLLIAVIVLVCLVTGGFVLRRHYQSTSVALPPAEAEKAPVTNQAVAAAPQLSTNTIDEKARYLEEKAKDQAYDWKRPIEFYGIVQDQNNLPISGVAVRIQFSNLSPEGGGVTNLTTDNGGRFSVAGIQGKTVAVFLTKPGYSLRREDAELSFEYADPSIPWFHRPNQKKPITFKMFKHGEIQALIHNKASVSLRHDGMESQVLFSTGEGKSIGPLRIRSWTEERSEQTPKPTWSVELAIDGGGLTEAPEEFAVVAPAAGYADVFRKVVKADDKEWVSMFEKSFYFKTTTPALYGRFKLRFLAWGETAQIEYWINPTGLDSLETGPSKSGFGRR